MDRSARVLLIEDDPGVAEVVSFHLEQASFSVTVASGLEQAWALLEVAQVVVLDWMLPDGSGLDVLRTLRDNADDHRLPVLMLTARASEMDRVTGLEAGADDYLVKPFSAAELVARVRALLRRVRSRQHIVLGELLIDVDEARAVLGGTAVPLTRREFELLAFLAAHSGRVYTRSELLDRVWGKDFLGTERTVDQHIAQLRSWLTSLVIETVRGRGYRLVRGDDGG